MVAAIIPRTTEEQKRFLAISRADDVFCCVVLQKRPEISAYTCVLRQDTAREAPKAARHELRECLACGDGELVAKAIRCTLRAIPTVEVPIATLTKPTSEK